MGYGRGLVFAYYRFLNLFFIATNFFNTRMRLMFSGLARETHVYAMRGKRRMKLDVYRPRGAEGPVPVIVYAHGGGWIVGWRRLIEPAFARQVKRGYALVSFTYTFTNQDSWPAQIHDTKAAIRWVRANADRFGFDTDKIVLTGASAGGHLACVSGLSGKGKLEGDLGNAEMSSDVCGIAVFYPPADLPATITQGFVAGRCVEALIGGKAEVRLKELHEATPISYARSDAPPLLVLHGTHDHIVPHAHGSALVSAIQDAGGNAKLISLEKRAHADWRFSAPSNMREIEAFLDRVTNRDQNAA